MADFFIFRGYAAVFPICHTGKMNDNEWKEYLRKQQENFTEYQRLQEERQRESEARRLKSEALMNQTREALLRTIEHQNRAKKLLGLTSP